MSLVETIIRNQHLSGLVQLTLSYTHRHGIMPIEQLIVLMMLKILLSDCQNNLASTSLTPMITFHQSSIKIKTDWSLTASAVSYTKYKLMGTSPHFPSSHINDTGWRKISEGHPISLQIFWKLHCVEILQIFSSLLTYYSLLWWVTLTSQFLFIEMLLSFTHTVQIDLSITQELCFC